MKKLLCLAIILMAFSACKKDKDKDNDGIIEPPSYTSFQKTTCEYSKPTICFNSQNTPYVGFYSVYPGIVDYYFSEFLDIVNGEIRYLTDETDYVFEKDTANSTYETSSAGVYGMNNRSINITSDDKVIETYINNNKLFSFRHTMNTREGWLMQNLGYAQKVNSIHVESKDGSSSFFLAISYFDSYFNTHYVKVYEYSDYDNRTELGEFEGLDVQMSYNVSENKLYLSYRDNANNFTIKKWNGTDWLGVSLPDISNDSFATGITSSGSKTYFLFKDGFFGSLSSIWYYENNTWTYNGSITHSAYGKIAVNNNKPIISLKNSGDASISVYINTTDTNWISIGDCGISNGYDYDLFSSEDGDIYLGMIDTYPTLYRYNSGTTWDKLIEANKASCDALSVQINPVSNNPVIWYTNFDGYYSSEYTSSGVEFYEMKNMRDGSLLKTFNDGNKTSHLLYNFDGLQLINWGEGFFRDIECLGYVIPDGQDLNYGLAAYGKKWTCLDSDNKPIAAVHNTVDNIFEVYKYHSGSTWDNLGSPSSGVNARKFEIAVGNDSRPVVLLIKTDGNIWNQDNEVYKYDGATSWTNLDLQITGNNPTMTVNSDNEIFVAFNDTTVTTSPVKVLKYANGSWLNIGTASMTGERFGEACIAVGVGGNPFVSFKANIDAYNWQYVISQYANGGWTELGYITDGDLSTNIDPYLAVDKNNKPAVVYGSFNAALYEIIIKIPD